LVIVTGSADDSGNSFSFTGYSSKEYVSISKLGFIRSRASDLNGANIHFIDNGGTLRMEMAVNTSSMTWYSHALASTFMVFQHTTGNVGIGTTSPGFKLNILGGNGNQLGLNNAGERFTQLSFLENGSQNSAIWLDGTDNMFDIYANTSHGIRLKTGGDNTRLTVTSGGNVLIGTTTDAGYKLYVSGTGTSTNLAVVGNIKAGGTGTAGGEIIASGALGNGNFVSLRHDDTNAYITVTRTVYDGHLILQPYGNVGIGTTAPGAKLDIVSTGAGSEGLRVDGAGGGFAFVVKAGSDYTSHIRAGATIGVNYFTTPPSNGLIVEGNVGIGTTSPTSGATLAVAGNILVQATNSSVFFGTGAVAYGDSGAIGRASTNGFHINGSIAGDLCIGAEFNSSIRFGTGASVALLQRMAILAGGNVAIGNENTSEVNERLNVTGNGIAIEATDGGITTLMGTFGGTDSIVGTYTNNNLQIRTNNTSRIFVTSAGNVGIGTTAPTAILQTVSSGLGDGGGIRITNSAAGGDDYRIWPTATINGEGAGKLIFSNNGGNVLTLTSTGNVGIGQTSPGLKFEVVGASSNWSSRFSSNNGADAYFAHGGGYGAYINAGSSASSSTYILELISNGSTRMFVRGDGNVGIGTTSPDARLHVNSDGTLNTQTIVLGIASLSQRPMIQFSEGSAATAGSGMSIEYDGRGSGVSNKMYINDVNSSPVFTVMSGGNVGIGNTDPSQKLHVTGNVRVTGAFIDSNNEAGTSGQILTSTGSGTDWVAPASLYDLLPAARVAYDWTVQMTSGTWADIFSSNTVLSNGTWMVQIYVSDYASGGEQYMETYSGVLSWGSAGGTNAGGANAISEVVLHRSGHSAQAGNFYLRTQERFSSTLLLQGMVNYSHTSNTTINFKFVKVF
jgi:hypothetical protein